MMDLSNPFFRVLPSEEGWIEWECNRPNYELGDQATEWWTPEDWDKYKDYIEELRANGTLGDLVYTKYSMKKNPAFDCPEPMEFPFTSYKLIIVEP